MTDREVDPTCDDPQVGRKPGYTILLRASERAARNSTKQTSEEGKLVEHHQYKILQVVQAHEVEWAALRAKAQRLEDELTLAKAGLMTVADRVALETQHDRAALADYVTHAPQYQDNRAGKSFPFAWGRIATRRKTTRQGMQVLDEAAIAALFPGCVEAFTKIKLAELKKQLTIEEDGRVLGPDGMELPREVVQGFARHTDMEVFAEIGGVRFDLQGGTIDDGNYDDADGEASGSAADYFAPDVDA